MDSLSFSLSGSTSFDCFLVIWRTHYCNSRASSASQVAPGTPAIGKMIGAGLEFALQQGQIASKGVNSHAADFHPRA
jgi:hypothetical protein